MAHMGSYTCQMCRLYTCGHAYKYIKILGVRVFSICLSIILKHIQPYLVPDFLFTVSTNAKGSGFSFSMIKSKIIRDYESQKLYFMQSIVSICLS